MAARYELSWCLASKRASSEKLKIVFIALLQWHHRDHRSALSKLGSKTWLKNLAQQTCRIAMTETLIRAYRIAAIPGDGIGTEVVSAGIEVLHALAKREARFQFKVDHF